MKKQIYIVVTAIQVFVLGVSVPGYSQWTLYPQQTQLPYNYMQGAVQGAQYNPSMYQAGTGQMPLTTCAYPQTMAQAARREEEDPTVAAEKTDLRETLEKYKKARLDARTAGNEYKAAIENLQRTLKGDFDAAKLVEDAVSCQDFDKKFQTGVTATQTVSQSQTSYNGVTPGQAALFNFVNNWNDQFKHESAHYPGSKGICCVASSTVFDRLAPNGYVTSGDQPDIIHTFCNSGYDLSTHDATYCHQTKIEATTNDDHLQKCQDNLTTALKALEKKNTADRLVADLESRMKEQQEQIKIAKAAAKEAKDLEDSIAKDVGTAADAGCSDCGTPAQVQQQKKSFLASPNFWGGMLTLGGAVASSVLSITSNAQLARRETDNGFLVPPQTGLGSTVFANSIAPNIPLGMSGFNYPFAQSGLYGGMNGGGQARGSFGCAQNVFANQYGPNGPFANGNYNGAFIPGGVNLPGYGPNIPGYGTNGQYYPGGGFYNGLPAGGGYNVNYLAMANMAAGNQVRALEAANFINTQGNQNAVAILLQSGGVANGILANSAGGGFGGGFGGGGSNYFSGTPNFMNVGYRSGSPYGNSFSGLGSGCGTPIGSAQFSLCTQFQAPGGGYLPTYSNSAFSGFNTGYNSSVPTFNTGGNGR